MANMVHKLDAQTGDNFIPRLLGAYITATVYG